MLKLLRSNLDARALGVCVFGVTYVEVVLTKFSLWTLKPFCPILNGLVANDVEHSVDVICVGMTICVCIHMFRSVILGINRGIRRNTTLKQL